MTRSVWAAVVIVAVLAVGLLAWPFLGIGGGGPTVADAYACSDQSVCAVAVRFSGPVDHAAVEKTVQLDPPAPVTFRWQGNTLFVKPAQPLAPRDHYTLSVRADPKNGRATPVAVRFVVVMPSPTVVVGQGAGNVPPSGPSATGVAGASRSPVAAGLVMPTIVPTTTLTVSATATLTMTLASQASCALTPVRGFGTLYQAQPTIASRLGCASDAEIAANLVVQPFANGRMIEQTNRGQLLVLVDGQSWQSFPVSQITPVAGTPLADQPSGVFGALWREHPDIQTALGKPTAPQQAVTGATESFAQGTMLWTPDYVIDVLYSDGTWQKEIDTFRDATTTVTPAATNVAAAGLPVTVTATPTLAAPSVTPSATASPTVTPVTGTPLPTPTFVNVANCPSQPTGRFGLAFHGHAEVAGRLGCPTGAAQNIPMATEAFQHGMMFWRGDVHQITVLRADGSWTDYPDTFQEGEVLSDVGPAPSGLFAPIRGFGKVWRLQPGVRDSLGWATGSERGVDGQVQEFAHGRLLWVADGSVYVFFAGGTSEKVGDTYVPPTPPPKG